MRKKVYAIAAIVLALPLLGFNPDFNEYDWDFGAYEGTWDLTSYKVKKGLLSTKSNLPPLCPRTYKGHVDITGDTFGDFELVVQRQEKCKGKMHKVLWSVKYSGTFFRFGSDYEVLDEDKSTYTFRASQDSLSDLTLKIGNETMKFKRDK